MKNETTEPGQRVDFGPAFGETEMDKTLLIVDDDRPFSTRLQRAMEARGFVVSCAHSVADGLAVIANSPPAFAVIDMRLADGNGLDVISELKAKRPDARAIILTGYGNIVDCRDGGETRRLRLSRQTRRCRRDLCGSDGDQPRQG